jgi:hypothetical protein
MPERGAKRPPLIGVDPIELVGPSTSSMKDLSMKNVSMKNVSMKNLDGIKARLIGSR